MNPTLVSGGLLRRCGAVIAAMLVACATLPPLPARTATHAEPAPTASTLGASVAASSEKAAPGHSGLRVLLSGEEALATLLALADRAERTLDLQYYAVLNEVSSRVVLQRVRAAAERGVRVRLLIDDLNTSGTDDALARLTRHPKIDVRLYNPLPSGRRWLATKVLGSLPDAARVNSRMHNKAFIADNALAVTGGRNLGDAYFLGNQKANFVDLDVLVAGRVVHDMSRMFDAFWNSELAYPAHAIVDATPPPPAASSPLDAPDRLPEPPRGAVEAQTAALARGSDWKLEWMPARLIADLPSKSLKQGEPNAAETMFDDLRALLRSAEREVLIVTPYFVPGADGMALIGELRRRGVRVRVLTASLAGTDAPIVHAGYSRYRAPLLALGVELFELRPEFEPPRQRTAVHSRTNLHAKAVIVDARMVLVGSMNVDPRSDKHNTEMGLLARSGALAGTLLKLLEPVFERGAYRLARAEDGRLRWIVGDGNGGWVELKSDPQVGALKRLGLTLLAPFAPESLL